MSSQPKESSDGFDLIPSSVPMIQISQMSHGTYTGALNSKKKST
jgi:hypothetical protein